MRKHRNYRYCFVMIFMLIMTNYAVASENKKSNNSLYNYIVTSKNMVLSVGSYCQHLWDATLNYFYNHVAPISKDGQDVKIQILGRHHEIDDDDDDDGLINDDVSQYDVCPANDVMCQENMTFFNRSFMTGLLNQNGDASTVDIDERDQEYRRYRQHELKLLYGASTDDEYQ